MKKLKKISAKEEKTLLMYDVALTFDHAFRMAYFSLQKMHSPDDILLGFSLALKAFQQERLPEVMEAFETVPKKHLKDFCTLRDTVDAVLKLVQTPTKATLQ